MLKKLSNPQTLILGAIQSFTSQSPAFFSAPHLLGLFSGWVIMDELEIDNLVVAKAVRQQGIGRALLAEGLQQAQFRGANQAFLEVREGNIAALNLYRTFGFNLIGRRRGYYHDPSEGALVLRLDLLQVASDLNLRQS